MAKIVRIGQQKRPLANQDIMKPNHPTDRIFREKLGDLPADPPMHLWEGIERRRTPAHRARLLARRYWVAGLLLFLLVGGGLLWGLKNNASDLVSQPLIVSTPVAKSENPVSNNAQTTDTPKSAAEAVTPATDAPEGGRLNEKKDAPTSRAPFFSTKAAREKAGSGANENQTVKTGDHSIFSQKNTKSVHADKSAIEATGVPVAAISEAQKMEMRLDIPARLGVHSAGVTTSDLSKPMVSPLTMAPEVVAKKRSPRLGCPEIEKGKKFNIYLDAIVAPEYARRTLEARSPDHVGYLKARETTEKSRFAASGGLRLSILTKSGLAFRTGLIYSQISEKFDYHIGNAQQITITPIQLPDGTVIMDTTIVFGDRFITTYNRLHLLDIPLIAGYELGYEKWTFSLNGGAFFNFLFRQKGKFLSPDLTPVSFSSGDAGAYPAFRDHVGVSFFGSLSINYALTDKIKWVVEPQFRYFPQSFTRNDYLLDQRYLTAGVNLGLRVQL
ncbi:MAG: PorT family protein [Bacteroidetes bacterium]|nr:MAG: PorT family protein [Bacteroidota bacterium]